MKELEKTKRISFSAVIVILAVVIGVLSFKKPKNIFKKDNNITLKHIVSQDFIISSKDVNSKSKEQLAIIDVRNGFEYNKGHLKNAKNIYTPNLLEEANKEYFTKLENENKTIVLYASTPNETSGPWMLLTQMGYKNVKISCVQTNYINNKFSISDYPLEKPKYDFAAFMKKATSGAVKTKKVTPKRVITVKKKKKRPVEGGC